MGILGAYVQRVLICRLDYVLKEVGKEFDLRVRFPINPQMAVNIGYAHFWAGDFVKKAVQISSNNNDSIRADDSDFFYTEVTLYGF